MSYIPAPDTKPDPSVCTLYLVRHGEVANAHKICLNGHFDIELSGNGLAQSQLIADRLSAHPVNAVYSSDLKRTGDGADLIAKPHELTPTACPELRELSFGKWEGLSVKELNEQQPGMLDHRFQNPHTFQADGGESFQDLTDRVLPRFHQIAEAHLGETIVIVAHGGVNRVILCDLLGFPLKNLFRISQEYAAVNRILYRPGSPLVDFVNGTAEQLT